MINSLEMTPSYQSSLRNSWSCSFTVNQKPWQDLLILFEFGMSKDTLDWLQSGVAKAPRLVLTNKKMFFAFFLLGGPLAGCVFF